MTDEITELCKGVIELADKLPMNTSLQRLKVKAEAILAGMTPVLTPEDLAKAYRQPGSAEEQTVIERELQPQRPHVIDKL